VIFIGKAPYRISLLGGGSDLDWFVREKGYGICFGFSLKEYSYSVLNILPNNAKRGLLDYSTREIYSSINDIVHPIVREVLKDFDISRYIELKTFGFASGGAGLGGSSSFLLSLISSIANGFDIQMTNEEIVEKACSIEINNLNKPIGKQDQYLCAYSDFNSFTFFDNDLVERNQLSSQKLNTLRRLANDFYLIPTYKKRNSDTVLSAISKCKDSLEKIMEIRSIASQFLSFDDNRDYKIEQLFHESMKDSWDVKKTLSNVMTESLTDQYEIINKYIPNNWIRLIGAGSGGYFLVSAKIQKENIDKLVDRNGIKGIFKVSISDDGISSFKV
tara:strand:+ start:472 stop:1464 length:993 start_codon:yes stop_codon:yes gene_type:complete